MILEFYNQNFQELLGLEASAFETGMTFDCLVRIVAAAAELPAGAADTLISTRIGQAKCRSPAVWMLRLRDGRSIAVHDQPLPDGGLVTICFAVPPVGPMAAAAGRPAEQGVTIGHDLIEIIPVPIFYKDSAGRYLGCNRAFEAFLGRPRQEIIGRTVFDIAQPQLAQGYSEADRRLLAAGGVQFYEAQVEHPEKGLRDIQFAKACFPGADGGVGGLVGTMLDVTERRAAEAALRRSEERYALVMAATGDTLWEWDPRTDRAVRPQFQEILGLDGADCTGRRWLSHVHPDDAAAYQAALRDHLRGKTERYVSEYRLGGPAGGWRWLLDRGIATRDDKGRAIGMIGSTRDISLRKEAERELQRRETLLRLLLDIALAASEAVGADAALACCLSHLCDFTGWPLGHVYVFDADGGDAMVSTALWYPDAGGRFASFCAATRDYRFRSGIGLPGQVLASGAPVWITDLATDSRFLRTEAAAADGIRSAFALPVTIRGATVAVVEFFSDRLTPPDPALLSTLAHIGVELGRVIERKRQEEALRRANDELERGVAERTRALKDSEARFRDIVEIASDWFWEMGPDLRFTYLSPRFSEMTGRPVSDLVGKTRWDHVDPEQVAADPEGWQEHRRIIERRQPFRGFEFWVVCADGHRLPVQLNGAPVFDETGAFQGYRGSATDITARRQAEAALRQIHEDLERRIEARTADLRTSEERLRLLLESSAEGILGLDRQGLCSFCNPAAVRLLGYDRPADLVGRPVQEVFHHTDGDGNPCFDATCPILRTCREGPGFQRDDLVFRARTGSPIQVEVKSRPLISDGQRMGAVISFSDIGARRQTEDTLRKLSRAVEQSPASVVITDTDGRIEYVNPKFVELTGYSAEEAIGRNPNILKSGYTSDDQYRQLWKTIGSGHEWRGELLNCRKDGALFWEFASISPIRGPAGDITHYLAVKEDITVRKQYEEQLVRQANYDQLTGLPNRLLAFDRLQTALARSRRDGDLLSLLFIDIDNFKHVNDTLGHAAGDCLLQESAARIKTCLREEDTVARFGGDEFMIILSSLKAPVHAEVVANKVLEKFLRPFDLDGCEVFSTASIGVTIAPLDGSDAHVLMRNADSAMYQAKAEGRNTYRFFTEHLNRRARRRMIVDSQLRRALERQEFHVVYQPLIEVASGGLIGAEALLRWHNAELGEVPPEQFIPLAEETGQIIALGEWVLETVCRQLRQWHDSGLDLPSVAINVSSRQFRGAGLVESLERLLPAYRLSARHLELEITESLLVDDMPHCGDTLNLLAEMGFRLSVDDFGTGYSSLGYLRRFPLHSLKIDRSFIRDVTTNSEAAALAEAIIAMAQRLHLKVTGEGVETAEQLAFLSRNGCNFAQGFHIGRPLVAEAFAAAAASFPATLPGWPSGTAPGSKDVTRKN